MVGDDYEGETLKKIFAKWGMDSAGVMKWPRPTALKTRYFLDDRQYFRIDREERSDVDKKLTGELTAIVESKAANVDCIAVSDYDKGTVTARLLNGVARVAGERNIPAFGQPKIRHYLDFINFNCVKSTIREASRATGIAIMNESSLHNLGIHLLNKLRCRGLVLTRGVKGLTVFEGNTMMHLPPISEGRELGRIIGIRDAMMAVLTLCLASDTSSLEAAMLCNVVASISRPKPETMILQKFERYFAEVEGLDQAITQLPLRR
jgi:D-beta-D-heptose 7-phosphate kinase/D-beta-D-heptose 1-phosphate adenosyltransferase